MTFNFNINNLSFILTIFSTHTNFSISLEDKVGKKYIFNIFWMSMHMR